MKYFDIIQNDPTTFSNEVEYFPILQAIFEDCDACEEEPDPDYLEIDEPELRRLCAINLAKLKDLVKQDPA